MKVIVLHGENEVVARDRLFLFISEAKKRGWAVEKIKEGESFSERFSLGNLYFLNTLFIVESYRILSKKDFVFLNNIFKKSDKVLVVCGLGENIPQSILNKFPKETKIETFNYPKIIFDFLDSILPGNSEKILKLLHEVLKKNPPELVFHLFFTRIRDLYWVKVDPSSLPYYSKRVYYLEKQASQFGLEKLKDILNYLADIDVEAKMSSLGMDYYLDLLVLKHLQ